MTPEEKRAKRLEEMQRQLHITQRSSSDQELMEYVQGRAAGETPHPLVAPEEEPPTLPAGAGPVVFPAASLIETSALTPEPAVTSALEGQSAVFDPITGPQDSHAWFRIAEQAAAFRRSKEAARKAVAVSAEVFSRVSYLALEFNLGKIEVLSWAMGKYVPEGKLAKLPRWLVLEEDAPERKTFFLSYLEDQSLADRLRILSRVFGLQTVDVVECVVLHAFPAAPHPVPSKRRRKFNPLARRTA